MKWVALLPLMLGGCMAVTLPSYDLHVNTVSLTPVQVGTESGGVWTDGSLPVTKPGGGLTGFTFDFVVSVDSERSLALAPDRPFTAVTGDLAGTGESDNFWTLTLATTLTSTQSLQLFAIVDSSPALFSSSNVPDVSSSSTVYNLGPFLTSSTEWVLNGSTYDLVVQLDFLSTLSTTEVVPLVVDQALNQLFNNGQWNGRFQILISGPVVTVTAATFAGLTQAFHTGQMGLDIKRRARVVHDYINGFPYLSDEAVEDPWRDGVMVHFSSADPDEIRKHHSYVPPVNEGVVDDEVPKVE